MAKSTISVGFKIEDGKDGLQKLIFDANALKKVMQASVNEAKSLKKSMINLGALSFGLDAMTNALGSLQSAMSELVGAYNVQIEAETKLQTVMQERLGATEAEIQSIKDLCAAQQQLGVIGDEVQLAGAQQLTTFLNTRSALEILIPSMNNLVAQQKGYNATAGDAVTVGNLMGKVMQGQTSALKRVGITFSEAEEKALKFGTEEERASILAQIITNNVGEMNAALAATPTGKMKQAANNLGDLKEKIGGVLAGLNQIVMPLNQFVLFGTNITKVTSAVKVFGVSAYKSFIKAENAMIKLGNTSNVLIAKMSVLKFALGSIIPIAVAGAIYALVKGLQKLSGQTEDTKRRLKMMAEIHSEASKNAEEQKISIDLLVKAAKNEMLSLEERESAIKKLNSIIPDYNAALDQTTGKYKENKVALDNYLRSLVKQYEIEGAKNKLQEIGRRKAEARIARTEAIKKHNKIKAQSPGEHSGMDIEELGKMDAASTAPLFKKMVDDSGHKASIRSSYNKIVDATKDYNKAVSDERLIMQSYGLDMQKAATQVNKSIDDLKGSEKSKLDLGTSKWYQDLLNSQETAKKMGDNISQIAEVGRAAASAFSAMGNALENPAINIAAIIAGAIANVMAGYAQASAKPTVSPWEWLAFSISGLATALAAVSQIKQVTAFANGGIVSGPTMALIGEYAGAKNNPEVIAPLNKLRDLLPDPNSHVQQVVVTGRIKGGDIVLAGSNYNSIRNKSKH